LSDDEGGTPPPPGPIRGRSASTARTSASAATDPTPAAPPLAPRPCISWMGHKTYGRCVLFGSANCFASTTALARSIEAACGISPYLSALETPQSKLRTSLQDLCSQSEDRRRNTANVCAANQDTAEHKATYVQPIRSENIKEWRRDRPRSDALVLRAAPASIVEYRLKNCLALSASSMPPLGFECVTHRMNIPHEHASKMNFTLHNEQNRQQDNAHRPRTWNPVLLL
jgi:hypothetical protein